MRSQAAFLGELGEIHGGDDLQRLDTQTTPQLLPLPTNTVAGKSTSALNIGVLHILMLPNPHLSILPFSLRTIHNYYSLPHYILLWVQTCVVIIRTETSAP